MENNLIKNYTVIKNPFKKWDIKQGSLLLPLLFLKRQEWNEV